MADTPNAEECSYPLKLRLSRKAWHQVGRVAMLDELLREIRTASGNDFLKQPELVIWLSEKRKAEVGKLLKAKADRDHS